MLKIVLVDDEKSIRKGLERMIRWEALGLKIIGSYDNAVEALDGIRDEMPDILLTDIKMPEMNGIELIHRAKEMYPMLECIILSGYDEFPLAQAAMSEGVKHYLLKPCTKEKAEKILEACAASIKKSKEELVRNDSSRRMVIDTIIYELLERSYEERKLTSENIKQVMAPYKGTGVLRETAILLMLRYPVNEDYRKRLDSISEVFEEREKVYGIIADCLNELQQKNKKNDTFVDKMQSYVEKHYGISELTLRYVAEEVVHVNAQYAGKKFYKQTGKKFSEYLLEVRMEQTKRLLDAEPDCKMYEIAERVGLGHDVQYFYLIFKKYTGMTPKEFQQRC